MGRRSTSSKFKTGGPTLEQVHAAINAYIASGSPIDGVENGKETQQNNCNDGNSMAIRAAEEQRAFDDALHRLVHATSRPSTEDDLADLCRLLRDIVDMCDAPSSAGDGSDEGDTRADRWKQLVLSLIHRRYHLRAPEARLMKEERMKKKKNDDDDDESSGDGERLLFYVAASYLLRRGAAAGKMARLAARCLFRLAPHAGGSRDVCSLIEHGVCMIVSNVRARLEPSPTVAWATGASSPSTSEIIAAAVAEAKKLSQERGQDDDGPLAPLFELIKLAGETLDADLKVARGGSGEPVDQAKEKKEDGTAMSTMHVFVPHRDRGRNRNNKRNAKRRRVADSHPESSQRQSDNCGRATKGRSLRNLVQCVSELLIWSKVGSTASIDAFRSAIDGLGCANDSARQSVLIHLMQAVVRKERQTLNSYARSRGYMLCNQFVLNGGSSVTFPMVRRGKTGDVTRLTALANKKGDTRVLKLVTNRFLSDASKAVPAESVKGLKASWVPLGDADGEDSERDNDLVDLTRKIQKATVQATVQKLRQGKEAERPHAVASIDNSDLNHAAAVLVGAALTGWDETDAAVTEEEARHAERVRVYINDRLIDVSSLDATIKELDTIFGGAGNEEGVATGDLTGEAATTRNALNFLERHVSQGHMIVLFTESDLKLADHTVEDLRKKNCSIHCHNADELKSRLDREGAKTGDVTISLMWESEDDLDLHVVMPSGEEISYSNKNSSCGLGCLDVDMNAGSPYTKEPVENVHFGDDNDWCPIQAPTGKYRVFVQNYAYHAKGASDDTVIPWTVTVRANDSVTKYEGSCVGSGSKSNTDVCTFEYEGRTVPFKKELKERSAFGSADIVCITASIGQTLESLKQLVRASEEHTELGRVRELVDDEEDIVDEDKSGNTKKIVIPPMNRMVCF